MGSEEADGAASRDKTNSSKLSAAAPPFSPGTKSLSNPIAAAAVANGYDHDSSQEMISLPVRVPPVSVRIRCGPRLPMYFRKSRAFQMKHEIMKYQIPVLERAGFASNKVMNPNAPEFVPGSSWAASMGVTSNGSNPAGESADAKVDNTTTCQVNNIRLTESEKSELARQILLSFIVKSVQNNTKTDNGKPSSAGWKAKPSVNSSELITTDSAKIKIIYGDGGNTATTQLTDSWERDTHKRITLEQEAEGFVIVKSRRKSRGTINNGVNSSYKQPSVCA